MYTNTELCTCNCTAPIKEKSGCGFIDFQQQKSDFKGNWSTKEKCKDNNLL